MILSTLAYFLVLPFVAADGIHKLKLQKLPPAINNPFLETAYLAQKYGAVGPTQVPMMGAGGAGRRFARPGKKNGEDFWTQEELKGGHGVPLSSK